MFIFSYWSILLLGIIEVFNFTDTKIYIDGLERRLKIAEGHIEAGRLLAFYQVCVLIEIPSFSTQVLSMCFCHVLVVQTISSSRQGRYGFGKLVPWRL